MGDIGGGVIEAKYCIDCKHFKNDIDRQYLREQISKLDPSERKKPMVKIASGSYREMMMVVGPNCGHMKNQNKVDKGFRRTPKELRGEEGSFSRTEDVCGPSGRWFEPKGSGL